MARYQARRPTPVIVVPRRFRRQEQKDTPAPGAQVEEEEEEGPESPDSLASSPSTVGATSESEDSESEDEEEEEGPPSPTVNEALSPPQQAANATLPSLTLLSSQGGSLAALPQVTSISSSIATSQPAITPTVAPSISSRLEISSSGAPTPAAPAPVAPTSSQSPATTAQPDMEESETSLPLQSKPQDERTLITKGAAAAAITLSVLGNSITSYPSKTSTDFSTGALAVVIAAVLLIKRRKRRQRYNQPLADDAFNPGNTGSLHAPETAHVATNSVFGLGGQHLTRSTERSDTLFGPGPYVRPDTVTTDRNNSRFPVKIPPPQPTPNPFVDPPLNKAYDVLAGRPRSTTLTDRGSWVKNPFRDPESERFDPFGELQQKARDERKRYLEASRKDAEAARQAEISRQFGQKEKMGLSVPDNVQRKGSDVTIAGLGVLDRSGGDAGYR